MIKRGRQKFTSLVIYKGCNFIFQKIIAMVKIKTSAKHKHGHKNVIPHLGETFISPEGIVEVSTQEIAEKVIAAVPDFCLCNEDGDEVKIKPKVEENTLGKEQGKELKAEDLEEEEEDKFMSDQEADDVLKDKTLAQLQTLAKDTGMPADQWGTLQKPKLKEYLKNIMTGGKFE